MKNITLSLVLVLVLAIFGVAKADYFGSPSTLNGTNISTSPLVVQVAVPTAPSTTVTLVSTNASGSVVVGEAISANGVVVAYVPVFTNSGTGTFVTNVNLSAASVTISNSLYIATSPTNNVGVQAH
jgi:hypothetical protein